MSILVSISLLLSRKDNIIKLIDTAKRNHAVISIYINPLVFFNAKSFSMATDPPKTAVDKVKIAASCFSRFD